LKTELSGIRVTYSGLISLVVNLVALFIGMIFLVIVTRTVSQVDYGTWGLIAGLLVYPTMIEPIVSFWTTREIARGIESGRTAVFSNGILSIGGFAVYLLIAYVVSMQTEVQQSILLFGAIIVPLLFINRTLNAINVAWKPHLVSYGYLSFVVIEVISALIFVHFLQMGTSGIILAVTSSYIVSILVLAVFAREKIKSKIQIKFLKKWLKFSWLVAYPSITATIVFLDVIVFSVLTGTVFGVSYWTAAIMISVLIVSSGLVTIAIYPKLLQGSQGKYLEDNLIHMLYFGIPFTCLIIFLSRPILFLLNPVYEVAVPIVIIVALTFFLRTLSSVFQNYLKGMESVDTYEKSGFKDYLKSKLFFVPTLVLIQYSLYIILLIVMLLLLISTSSQFELVIYWSVIALVTQVPFTIYFYMLVRKNLTLKLDTYTIFKYLLVGIGVFGIVYVLTEEFLVYTNNLLQFVPHLFLFILFGIGSFFAITYLVDYRTRKLVKAIFHEFKSQKFF